MHKNPSGTTFATTVILGGVIAVSLMLVVTWFISPSLKVNEGNKPIAEKPKEEPATVTSNQTTGLEVKVLCVAEQSEMRRCDIALLVRNYSKNKVFHCTFGSSMRLSERVTVKDNFGNSYTPYSDIIPTMKLYDMQSGIATMNGFASARNVLNPGDFLVFWACCSGPIVKDATNLIVEVPSATDDDSARAVFQLPIRRTQLKVTFPEKESPILEFPLVRLMWLLQKDSTGFLAAHQTPATMLYVTPDCVQWLTKLDQQRKQRLHLNED